MFSHCFSLSSLPDILKWKFPIHCDKDYLYNECLLLLNLPDISSMKISNDDINEYDVNAKSLLTKGHNQFNFAKLWKSEDYDYEQDDSSESKIPSFLFGIYHLLDK